MSGACATPWSQAAAIAGDHVVWFSLGLGLLGLAIGLAGIFMMWRDRRKSQVRKAADPLGIGAPTEPPCHPVFDIVFDGLCGYQRAGL